MCMHTLPLSYLIYDSEFKLKFGLVAAAGSFLKSLPGSLHLFFFPLSEWGITEAGASASDIAALSFRSNMTLCCNEASLGFQKKWGFIVTVIGAGATFLSWRANLKYSPTTGDD